MAAGHEDFLDLPKDRLARTTGFALDIGGSMVKVAYAVEEESCVRVRFVAYPRERVQDAVDLLKQKCGKDIVKGSTINTCGNGFLQHRDTFCDQLGIIIDNKNEAQCFVDAYRFLVGNSMLDEITYRSSPSVTAYVQKSLAELMATFAKMKNTDDDANMEAFTDGAKTETPAAGAKPDNVGDKGAQSETSQDFPVLLCMLGSAVACMKVLEDGTYNFVEMSTRCGRTFFGLGQLITGAQNYEELLAMAAIGDQAKLNTLGKHVKTGDEMDVYGTMPDDVTLYCFGRTNAMSRDEVSDDDKAAALLTTVCQDVSQICLLAAMMSNTRKIVMCGGFPGDQLIREELEKAIGVKCLMNPSGVPYECHFLEFSSYFGALGALLRTLRTDVEETKL